MKVTIDISDNLYQRVAAECVRQGRAVDAVVAELLQRWLHEDARHVREPADYAEGQTDLSVEDRRQLAKKWLDEWIRMGEEAHRNALPGPSAREMLEEGRNRLERR